MSGNVYFCFLETSFESMTWMLLVNVCGCQLILGCHPGIPFSINPSKLMYIFVRAVYGTQVTYGLAYKPVK